ncbi:MAG TPA: ester cyclase [Kofleriaceae bacterium]|nr:ester cyclase [Kofleriaceae bacterium]
MAVLLTACGGGGKKPAAKPDPAAAAVASNAEQATAPQAKAEEPPPMSMAQRMEKTTRAMFIAWNAHEAETIANQYEADAILRIYPMPERTSREAIKAQAANTFVGYPDFKTGVRRAIMKDNIAVVEWTVTGTNTGDTPGTNATKRSVGVHGVSVLQFSDAGLIKEEHRYWDMPTQDAQLDPKAKKGTFRPVAELPTEKPATVASTGSPDEAKNLEVVNAVYAAIDAHKADEVLKYMDPNGGGDDYTEPASRQGTKGIKEYLGVFFKAVPDLKQDKIVQLAAGDLVVSEVNLHGTLKGNLGPMKATNKPINLHFVDIAQVKDGKVVHMTSYANSLELMPPPAAPQKK